MILATGVNWVRINDSDDRFIELVRLLGQAEQYIQIKDPRTLKCDYWGICKGNPKEEIVVRCSGSYEGERLAVSYKDVMRAFPELEQLMRELKIHPYIGKNYIGNWGIHRHAYGNKSRWNICILGRGNKRATINFHKVIDSKVNYGDCTNHYIYHLLEEGEKSEKVDTLNVAPGHIYSLNTWEWHSHITQAKDNRAEVFLLHIKNADTRQDVERTLKSIDEKHSIFEHGWNMISGLWK